MPAIGVQHCQRDFDQDIKDALAFLSEARTFKVIRPSGRYHDIGVRTAESLAGLALLRICLAWEEFIESVFLRYMCGAMSSSGFAPTLLLPPESRVSNAMVTLLSGGSYLNWSAHNTLNRANTYFDAGEPFATAMRSCRQTVDDIFIVRNRFAHRSEFANQRFRNIVLREYGYMPRGMTAGRFLLSYPPPPVTYGQMYIELYANTLLGASMTIVP